MLRGLVGLALLWVGTAVAGEGAIEISQAKALAGNVTPGDAAGFPVTISRAGSYRLTSNLDRTAAALNVHAIDIQVDDVTIDLGGFTILGGAVCTGFPVTACTNTGTGIGIAAFNVHGITIRNGVIRGMPGNGIRVSGDSTHVSDVTAISNGLNGIEIAGGLVVDSMGVSNFEDGIVSFGSIQRSVARTNRGDGFAGFISQVMNCYASSNGGFGLNTGNTGSSRVGYGGNMFVCNNSGGLCNNVAQVSGLVGLEIGVNVCGDDTVCP
jgi:hypothetical protein